MSAPLVEQDPTQEFVDELIKVIQTVYSPDSPYPPPGGGSTTVHLVTGEGPEWDPMAGRFGEQGGQACEDPFIWVRLVTRYRSANFPEATVAPGCPGIPVIVMEIGVGRCINIDPEPDWSVISREAEWGLDDAFRLDKIACVLSGYLGTRALVAADPATPEGPEGGGIVWSTTVYIGIV